MIPLSDPPPGEPTAASRQGPVSRAARLLEREGPTALVRKACEVAARRLWAVPPLRRLALARASERLGRWQTSERSIDDVLDTAYGFEGWGPFRPIEPSQVRSELKELAELVRAHDPRSLVEIGTKQGGTLYVWHRSLPDLRQAISIDLPGGAFGGGYRSWETELFQRFSDRVRLHCLRMNSHTDTCEERVADLCPPDGVDFLFIDGDHTYRGVREDFLRFRRYVADGGIVALHDIVPHPPETGCEVHRFWRELREGPYRTREIVRDPDQGWAGIGIVRL